MRTMLLILGCILGLTACVTMPYQEYYENPVRRNFRQQHLAQNPQLTPDIRQAITSRQVIAGMSRMDVAAAWGPPVSCSRVFTDPQSRTVCLYTDKESALLLGPRYKDIFYNSVYFEAGRVVDWQLH